MKILKIVAKNLPLFEETCEIDFLATQRVSNDDKEKLNLLFSNYKNNFYLNNVISFIGINASGKTTILKLITFVCKLLNNESINNIEYNNILEGINENNLIKFDIFFYLNDNIYLLHTEITKYNERYIITDEYIKAKSKTKIKNKLDLFNFINETTMIVRNNNEAYLLDDVSIIVALNKKVKSSIYFTDMLKYTNTNQLSIRNDCPIELISFFDSTIEYLHIETDNNKTNILLKFKNKPEIVLNQFSELNKYLSSGTIKGINTFYSAIKIFKNGGYLVVDELENHFNHEIVSTLIRFYFDKKININGATLIFSTHYAEILDEFSRNDSIYIVINNNAITAKNLTYLLNRNDFKKSEIYKSGYINGTTPTYDSYIALKKKILKLNEDM